MSTMHEIIEQTRGHFLFRNNDPFSLKVEIGHPKLCVVTGNNVSGKSLLRKVLFVFHRDADIEYIHLSQQGRKGGQALSNFVYGSEEDESTGYNSVGVVTGAIRTGLGRTEPFSIMLDEPEVGCSEELAAGLGIRIARDFSIMPQMNGMFIVSHSRHLVRQLLPLQPTHIRMGDEMTLEQWVNRDVVPVESLETLRENGLNKWRAVEKLINLHRESKRKN